MDNQLRNRVPGPTGPFMLRPTAVLVGTLLLAACETTVSLEEARQITASFEGFSYTPPPKTISDVVSLLDQQKPADPKAVEKARKTATREPPLRAKGDDLANFYWRRGLAARRIGDVKQQIADLKKALRHAVWADKVRMGQDLSLAEAVGGSFADAIRHLEESISAGPGKFAPIEQEATLAMLYARSGDLDAARRSLRMMGLRITNPGGDKAPGQVYLIEQRHRKSVPQATAVILDASGRYEEAEFAYRSSLRLAEDFVQRFAPQGSQRYLPPGYYDRWHYEKDSMRSGLAMLLLRSCPAEWCKSVALYAAPGG